MKNICNNIGYDTKNAIYRRLTKYCSGQFLVETYRVCHTPYCGIDEKVDRKVFGRVERLL